MNESISELKYAYMYNITIPTEGKETEIDWFTSAFWGLYVVEEDKELHLKFYELYNEGLEYDSDVSEPNHDYATTLSLQELGGF